MAAMTNAKIQRHGCHGLALVLGLGLLGTPVAWAGPVDYDIVYVRAVRYGDEIGTKWQEVKDPVRLTMGADLMLLHPDGTEELLVEGGEGSVVDPYPSFDGQWVYYAKFHDLRPVTINSGIRFGGAPTRGADIYKIHLPTRRIVQLTFGEWTPLTGAANWSTDPLKAVPSGTKTIYYKPFNLGPCPLPGGKVMFSSSRNGLQPNANYTFPNLQLFVMDDDGKNVEEIGYLNLGSALHPTVLMDGRVMFSSYESQGLRDIRQWGLWSIWPDGRNWGPLMSAFTRVTALHFQGQLSNGDIAVVDYYNQNNNGFGTIYAFPPGAPSNVPPFGSPSVKDPSNGKLRFIQNGGRVSFSSKFPFQPYGLYHMTPFSHGGDEAARTDANGVFMGRVTHPSGAPGNDLLLVWSPGPANNMNRPTPLPRMDGGIYLLKGGVPVDHSNQLVLVKNDPRYNEQQPRPVVPYRAIYGIDEPATLPWLPNDGRQYQSLPFGPAGQLPEGTPFGLVGTSSFYKRNSAPGADSANWVEQGSDAGKYSDSEMYAVRIIALETTSYSDTNANFLNYANERIRILGEIPLRKYNAQSQPILDVDGNPDTSFLAKIPADVPFTFQTIDKDGMVLNMAQTWHQVRPGEARFDCGGCHAHAQVGTAFEVTAAAKADYQIRNLTLKMPLLSKDAQGKTIVKEFAGAEAQRVMDVEYYRDIKPILQRSCVGCHSAGNPDQAGIRKLVLDDTSGTYENAYTRLADDPKGQYGIPSVNSKTQFGWGGNRASRYIWKLQSRRSLLAWKLFGRRLDGWTNSDFPTEAVAGDPATIPIDPKTNEPFGGDEVDLDYTGTIMPPPGSGYPPLSEDEQMLFARWIDLGAPISKTPPSLEKTAGLFLDEGRPTLAVSSPRAGRLTTPVTHVRIGAFDYYSGLDRASLSVKADIILNGRPAGTELAGLFTETGDHIWTMPVSPPLTDLAQGILTVRIKDQQGNWSEVQRAFQVDTTPDGTPPSVPTGLRTVSTLAPTELTLAWQPASDPDSGIVGYRIYREGAVIVPMVETTTFTDRNLKENTRYSYTITAVNGAGLESARSGVLSVTTSADTSAPVLQRVDIVDPTTIRLTFSEPLDPLMAAQLSRYQVDQGESIVAVRFPGDPRIVELVVNPPLTSEAGYQLTVAGVTDQAGNAVASLAQSALFTSSLVGRWAMDDGSGSVARDLSAFQHDGALTNGPTWAEGKIGGALRFDGVDDLVVVPVQATMGVLKSQPLTVAAWIKPESLGKVQTLVGTGTCGVAKSESFFLKLTAGNTISLGVDRPAVGGMAIATGTTVVPAGSWTHVAGIYDQDQRRFTLYINGVLDGSLEAEAMVSVLPDPLALGARASTGSTSCSGNGSVEEFTGSLDDVRLYNRALSVEEIRRVMQSDPAPDGQRGDLDRDGRITLIDLRQLIEMLIGARSVDLATADLNADNQLSLADLRALIQLLIG